MLRCDYSVGPYGLCVTPQGAQLVGYLLDKFGFIGTDWSAHDQPGCASPYLALLAYAVPPTPTLPDELLGLVLLRRPQPQRRALIAGSRRPLLQTVAVGLYLALSPPSVPVAVPRSMCVDQS